MDFHDIEEIIARPDLPTMGLPMILLTVAQPLRRLCERIAQPFRGLAIVVNMFLLACLHLVLVPAQILLAVFALIPIRIISRKGALGDNLIKWALAATPLVAYAVYFGPAQLMSLIKTYFLMG